MVYPRNAAGEKRFTRQNYSGFKDAILSLSCSDLEIGSIKTAGTNEVRYEPKTDKASFICSVEEANERIRVL
jgi:hypothetical protein